MTTFSKDKSKNEDTNRRDASHENEHIHYTKVIQHMCARDFAFVLFYTFSLVYAKQEILC